MSDYANIEISFGGALTKQNALEIADIIAQNWPDSQPETLKAMARAIASNTFFTYDDDNKHGAFENLTAYLKANSISYSHYWGRGENFDAGIEVFENNETRRCIFDASEDSFIINTDHLKRMLHHGFYEELKQAIADMEATAEWCPPALVVPDIDQMIIEAQGPEANGFCVYVAGIPFTTGTPEVFFKRFNTAGERDAYAAGLTDALDYETLDIAETPEKFKENLFRLEGSESRLQHVANVAKDFEGSNAPLMRMSGLKAQQI